MAVLVEDADAREPQVLLFDAAAPATAVPVPAAAPSAAPVAADADADFEVVDEADVQRDGAPNQAVDLI